MFKRKRSNKDVEVAKPFGIDVDFRQIKMKALIATFLYFFNFVLI